MIFSFFRSHLDVPLYFIWLIATAIVSDFICVNSNIIDIDNEFAEFEDPDDPFTIDLAEPVSSDNNHRQSKYQDQVKTSPVPLVDQTDDSEFAETETNQFKPHTPIPDNSADIELESGFEDVDSLQDDEEFEGLKMNNPPEWEGTEQSKSSKPTLKIVKVPHRLSRSWDTFHFEMLFIFLLLIYCLNYVVGRSKNIELANEWFDAHQSLLTTNFAVVGDDGLSQPGTNCLLKESEYLYSLWCTGSVHCDAMLIELRLIKRQCLLFAIANWLRPINDSIVVKVVMEDSEMDSWIMAIGRKRRLQVLSSDHQDLSSHCPEKRGQRHPNLPETFNVLNEIPEVLTALLNAPVRKFLTDYESSIDYLYFSDQYAGPKQPHEDSNSTKPIVTQKALIFAFHMTIPNTNTTASSNQLDSKIALFHFIFYMIDKVRRFRLSKEGKAKSERDRQRIHDSRLKSIHTQRQEAAQNRRGERMRVAKERIMAEDDPDRARKLEEKEQRKSKKFPKMKMLKMK